MERIIVTLRLAAVQHHVHAHLDLPLCVADSVFIAVPQSKMDHSRDPCPWVILNDFGGAFAMGVCANAHLGPEYQLTLIRLSVVQYGMA